MTINSISIIGSSSGRNAGDAALVAGIMDSIDRACGRPLHYEVPTYRPEFIRQTYSNDVQPVSMLPWHGSLGMFGLPSYLSITRADLSLIYDNMLFDRKLNNPLFNFMPAAEFLCARAKKNGKMYGLYNVGAGPVTTSAGRNMLRRIADRADFITVRDPDSRDLLLDVGTKNPNILVTADAALSLAPASDARVDEIMRGAGMAEEKDILAINVNAYLNTWADGSQKALTKEEFSLVYAKALDRIWKETGAPFLFVCTQHHDVSITTMIMERMQCAAKKALVSNIACTPSEIKGIFKRVALLFAMRLHASILCSGALTPSASLAFQKKVTSYYNLLGLSRSAFPFSEFSEDSLVENILGCWKVRAETRRQLEMRIPELVGRAYKAAELVALISGGIPPEEAVSRIRKTLGQEP